MALYTHKNKKSNKAIVILIVLLKKKKKLKYQHASPNPFLRSVPHLGFFPEHLHLHTLCKGLFPACAECMWTPLAHSQIAAKALLSSSTH